MTPPKGVFGGLALYLVFFVGCRRDYELEKQQDVNVASPDVSVDPWSLDFGGVPLGDSLVRDVEVWNRGNAVLDVQRLTPAGSSAFVVLDASLPVAIAPDESWVVSLAYSPTGEDVGRLDVSTNDPDSPLVSVELRGHAAYPTLSATPWPLDVGKVVRCGHESGVLTLENTGDAPLRISDLAALGSGWEMDAAPALPIDLEPGEQAAVTLGFSPLADGVAPGSLYVTSNDPREVVDVPLTARGEGYAVDERTETHIQPAGPYDGVDLVFFVDQSSSMDSERQALASQFDALAAALDDLGLDWQLAVVSADDGCANTGIISGASADAARRFADGLTGDWGWYAESGWTVASLALQAAAPGGCNAGLLRETAIPLVIAVADERDHSEPSWMTYALAMAETAPGVILNAVVGPVPDGCESAAAGTGYVDAAEWAGGVVESICDPDWPAVFADLGDLAGGEPTDTFPLEAPPAPGSVSVLVDGEPATGWTYDEDLQAVVFDEMPEGGVVIDILYVISSSCE